MKTLKSASQLAIIKDAEQTLHNLNTFPMGIKRLDDERDERVKRLKAWLKEHGSYTKEANNG